MHPQLHDLDRSFHSSPLNRVTDPLLTGKRIELWIKRDDLLHPIISGNKWRKLKYILDDALTKDVDTLVSMGGVYSNHLHALAYAGKILNLRTVGLVRGERPGLLTPTLQDAENWGMELRFIARAEYRLLRSYRDRQELPGIKDHEYWIPEGGANRLALRGAGEIANEIDIGFDTLCVACGTGTTLAGLIEKIPGRSEVLGFAALPKARFLEDDVKSQLTKRCHNWEIIHDYHFGGFAKLNSNLTRFINDFEVKTRIPLDPVYTAKMMYGIYDLIACGRFPPGHRIVALHTGGLQGKRGYI